MTDQPAETVTTYALYQHGRQRLAGGDARGAAEILELAVEREPSKASLQETLGRAYLASSRPRLARAAFERALELDPTDPFAHFGVGRSYEREGRLSDAAKHLKLACALADDERYRAALARVQARMS